MGQRFIEITVNVPEQLGWAPLAVVFGDVFVSQWREDMHAHHRWEDDGGPCHHGEQ